MTAGHNKWHTNNPLADNPKPFNEISFNGLVPIAKTPFIVIKPECPWFLNSGYPTRDKVELLKHGQFLGISGGFDKNLLPIKELIIYLRALYRLMLKVDL